VIGLRRAPPQPGKPPVVARRGSGPRPGRHV